LGRKGKSSAKKEKNFLPLLGKLRPQTVKKVAIAVVSGTYAL